TGKELVARELHRLSDRASMPCITTNCAAIVETLFDAEMFGHSRGAFTGAHQGRVGLAEQAHCGNLFPDEIGDLPLSGQAKLLRLLECGEMRRVGSETVRQIDIRVVAATNQDLVRLRIEGGFREDLYWRLNGAILELPPLRTRTVDIPILAASF